MKILHMVARIRLCCVEIVFEISKILPVPKFFSVFRLNEKVLSFAEEFREKDKIGKKCRRNKKNW
jgi:hypothetical protein